MQYPFMHMIYILKSINLLGYVNSKFVIKKLIGVELNVDVAKQAIQSF